MTFLAPQSIRSLDTLRPSVPTLSQRGRAGMQFLGAVQRYSSGRLRPLARADFEADPDARALGEAPGSGMPAWLPQARRIAERSHRYRRERFLQRLVAEEVYLRGVPAVEERRDSFERYLEELATESASAGVGGQGSLQLDPELPLPDYYRDIQWHLQPGGYDGYDLYGPFFAFVAGPCVFRHGGYAAVEAGDDIIEQRMSFVRQLRGSNYRRIYEPGCGGVSTLACVHRVYSSAELVGSDVSSLLLRMGHATARRLGVPVHFRQRDFRATGERDASVGAIVMYALLHEMPPAAAIDGLREAYRILAPGGELVNSDPPPFRAVDPFQAVVLDWDTEHREEPYFSAAASSNWAEELRQIGFIDVEEYGMGRHGYPWITRARKPR